MYKVESFDILFAQSVLIPTTHYYAHPMPALSSVSLEVPRLACDISNTHLLGSPVDPCTAPLDLICVSVRFTFCYLIKHA